MKDHAISLAWNARDRIAFCSQIRRARIASQPDNRSHAARRWRVLWLIGFVLPDASITARAAWAVLGFGFTAPPLSYWILANSDRLFANRLVLAPISSSF